MITEKGMEEGINDGYEERVTNSIPSLVFIVQSMIGAGAYILKPRAG